MQDLKKLVIDLGKLKKSVVNNLVEAQKEVAKQIEEDARENAPGQGKYANSIKKRATIVSSSNISTNISTKLMTDVAKSTGKQYNLGFLLETGTEMHAIPNAFNWGVIYGYNSAMYKRTLRKDWHPGFVSMPHFIPALDKNKVLYREKIKEALDEVLK